MSSIISSLHCVSLTDTQFWNSILSYTACLQAYNLPWNLPWTMRHISRSVNYRRLTRLRITMQCVASVLRNAYRSSCALPLHQWPNALHSSSTAAGLNFGVLHWPNALRIWPRIWCQTLRIWLNAAAHLTNLRIWPNAQIGQMRLTLLRLTLVDSWTP